MRSIPSLAAVSAAACLAAPAFGADELVFALDQAPPAALKAAMTAAPDVTFTAVAVEVEEGVVTLEFQGQRNDGSAVEVDVAMGWVALEVEDVIAFDAVPAPVREALALAMGEAFVPTSVEKSLRADAVIYEFEGADADGRAIDIEIKAQGDSVVVLDDDET